MPRAYVSVGSNIDPERNVRSCLAALAQRFGPLTLSPVYESQPVGFAGPPFLNLVVSFATDADPYTLARSLRAIEDDHGRQRSGERFGSRTLDLDLLLYGDLILDTPQLRLPRDEIDRYDFVLRPLADIAPEGRHPRSGRTYAALWAEFDRADSHLQPTDFAIDAHD
jgi:2-amino-4-hydroxy-6-hydroxymethyldihydropteridine diphosphokinase